MDSEKTRKLEVKTGPFGFNSHGSLKKLEMFLENHM